MKVFSGKLGRSQKRTNIFPWVFIGCLNAGLILSACDDSGSADDDKVQELNAALEAEQLALQENIQEQQKKQEEIDRLIAEIAEAEQKIKENQSTIEALKGQQKDDEDQLNQLNEENEKLLNDIEEKLAAIKNLESELKDQTQFVEELREELKLAESKLSEQESLVNQLQDELAGMAVGDPDYSRLEQELEEAKKRLQETEDNLDSLRVTLQETEYLNVQIFLENLGPERLFVMDDQDLRTIYRFPDDRQCHFLFSIDHKVEYLHNDVANSVPSISGFEALPLGIGYHKVAICGPKDETNLSYQMHHETGRIFKVIPDDNPNQRSLLTARIDTSCNSANREAIDNNVFSRRYQFIYPYSGSIDGIETMGILRPTNQRVEYTMGSSVVTVRSSSCEQLLNRSETPSLARVACQYINQEPAESAQIQLGCFSEGETSEDRVQIDFYPIEST
ncbi:MAG: hypothetical protein ACOH5I_12990 [Oligoflexus sp.]